MRFRRLHRTVIMTMLLVILTLGSISLTRASTVIVAPLTLISGPSPFANCTIGGGPPEAGSINYVNAEVEPWVEVNPTDPNNIIAVWQQDRWSNGGAHGLATAVSHDGGANWALVSAPHFSECAGGTAANGGNYQRSGDPWVTFAPNGDAYQSSVSVNPFDNFVTAILVSKSTDGGDHWSEPTTLIRDTNPRLFNDKATITADPTDSNDVYAVWNRDDIPTGLLIKPEHVPSFVGKGPALFSRTTTGGQTWEPARIIYDPGANNWTLGHQIVVLPDGTLVDLFTEFLAFKNSDGGTHFDVDLSLVRSHTKGAKWGKLVRAAKQIFQGALDPDTGRPIRAEGIIADVAVDRSPSSPGFGKLYAVWQDLRFRGVDEIGFSMSSDGGESWSTPIKVNQTPADVSNPLNQQAFVPAVQVAADGTVAVTYYDFRSNDSNPGAATDYWIVQCHADCAKGTNWGGEAHLDGPFDIEQAPAARGPFGFFVGDYEGLTSVGNTFRPVFVQVNERNPANSTGVFATTVAP
jgi:hypothetical protein